MLIVPELSVSTALKAARYWSYCDKVCFCSRVRSDGSEAEVTCLCVESDGWEGGEGKSRGGGCECSLAPLCVRASVRAWLSLSIAHLCGHAIQLLRRRRQQLRQRLAHRRQRYGPLLAGVDTVEQCLELAILDDLPVVPRHLKERKEEREWRVSGESEGMVIGEIGERCTTPPVLGDLLGALRFGPFDQVKSTKAKAGHPVAGLGRPQ